MKIAFLTLGLYEKSDSVGYDCVYEYRLLRERMPSVEDLQVFAENYDPELYPDIPAQGISAFYDWCRDNPDGVIIFHYCDSLTQYDSFLRERQAPVIIRWHNNTPPWFTFGSQNQSAMHALTGYENIIDYVRAPNTHFWVNSDFTRDQLLALGGRPDRCHTVFPASRYLEDNGLSNTVTRKTSFAERGISLLFVSRVVAHKGHRNAIILADRVEQLTGKPVTLHFAGKGYEDSNAFTAELRQMIANSSANVIVHGRVSEEKLIELYGNVDVFLCLSEHEGFGLPVFEAMRCRVPVVAWATTAFEELLDIHPLAFRHFDLDVFAAAVASLQTSKVRQRVLEVQYSLLQRYNAPLVETQIIGALGNTLCSWGQSLTGDLAAPALFRHPQIGANLSRWLELANTIFPQKFNETLIYDSHANITSLYDLKLVRTYIDLQKDLRRAALDHSAKPIIHFAPHEFSMREGTPLGSGIFSYTDSHLIYGPYVEIPNGKYVATFGLIVTIAQAEPVTFEFDTNSYGGERLADTIIKLEPGRHKVATEMEFELARGQSLVEFRFKAQSAFLGVVEFSGVEISLAPSERSPNNAAIAPSQHAQETKSLSIVSQPVSRPVSGSRLRRIMARRHFRAGNRSRDVQAWSEAASHYEAGLAWNPQNFEYLVQWGHMLKESGQYDRAEIAYTRAYTVDPTDVDLKLQLGHFYKIIHNLERARVYYQEAAQAGEQASHVAQLELSAL
ncbi:glycosyltransferase [Gluconobacter cerinus]|uniref:glycosyltransferase family 4 protein n=1 Tax=Gluconobacter cerinus TaxID=38307 RepID=UPI001B8AF107|nr:glycosyltransferase [Gluconobacter cerinus]MBS1070999.1 glycosyltransferase [Gluconobacter cerinus]